MRVRVGRCVVASAPGCLPAVSSWALHAVVLLIDLSCGCILSGSPVASLLFRSGWHLTLWSLRALASASYAERGLRDGCGVAVDSTSVYFGYSLEQCLWACLCMPVISWFLCSPCFCVLFCFSVWSPCHVAWISVWLRVWKVCVGVRLCWLHFVLVSIQCEYVPCIHSDVGL